MALIKTRNTFIAALSAMALYSSSANAYSPSLTKLVPLLDNDSEIPARFDFTGDGINDRVYLAKTRIDYLDGNKLLNKLEGYALIIEKGNSDGNFDRPGILSVFGEREPCKIDYYYLGGNKISLEIKFTNGSQPFKIKANANEKEVEKMRRRDTNL